MTEPEYTCCDNPRIKFNGGNPVCINCDTYVPGGTRVVLPVTEDADGTLTVKLTLIHENTSTMRRPEQTDCDDCGGLIETTYYVRWPNDDEGWYCSVSCLVHAAEGERWLANPIEQ
jgi:hypothetical protein